MSYALTFNSRNIRIENSDASKPDYDFPINLTAIRFDEGASAIEFSSVGKENRVYIALGEIATPAGLDYTSLKALITSWQGSSIATTGGTTTIVAYELTRPADVNAYSAGDNLGTILAVTGATNANPIVLTVVGHKLVDGQPVTTSGVTGNLAANADAFAKVLTVDTIALYSDPGLTTGIAGNGAYVNGGSLATLFVLKNILRAIGGTGYITKLRLITDQKTCVARFRMHIYGQATSCALDNAVYAINYANVAKRNGYIDMPAMITEDATSTSALSQWTSGKADWLGNGQGPLPVKGNGINTDLYVKVRIGDAFVPASGQKFYLEVTLENN